VSHSSNHEKALDHSEEANRVKKAVTQRQSIEGGFQKSTERRVRMQWYYESQGRRKLNKEVVVRVSLLMNGEVLYDKDLKTTFGA
jgi:hypothetical protein